MTSWLQKHRKSELTELAKQAGLQEFEGLLKDDLVIELDKHLRANASSLSSNAAFEEYYERSSTPSRKERNSAATANANGSDTEVPRSTRRRRAPRVKEESGSPAPSPMENIKTLATRTPRAVQRVAEQVPLPASPADVADVIERQTAIVSSKVGDLWAETGIVDRVEQLRETLSSLVSIEIAALLVELLGLRRLTLPFEYLGDTPAIAGLRSFSVHGPNFLRLVETSFWAPTTLWTTTSLILPLLFSYFFNLTLKTRTVDGVTQSKATYQADPLMFNIAKALITWLVYGKGVRFAGIFGDQTVTAVDATVFGGYQGIMIGTAIGVLTSLYDAAQRK